MRPARTCAHQRRMYSRRRPGSLIEMPCQRNATNMPTDLQRSPAVLRKSMVKLRRTTAARACTQQKRMPTCTKSGRRLPTYANLGRHRENQAREIRTPNLLMWSQTRNRRAIAPLAIGNICPACVAHARRRMYERRLSEKDNASVSSCRSAEHCPQTKLRPLATDADVTATPLRSIRLQIVTTSRRVGPVRNKS